MAWTTVSVTMSFLIGMALTRLLSGLVAVFRARTRAELDWVPVAWAAAMILALLEAWVALNSLPALIQAFNVGHFFSLAGLMLVLFAAAALLMPPGEIGAGESMKAFFIGEGRFALPLLSAYNVAATVANLILFGAEPAPAAWWALDLPLIALPALAFAFARSLRLLVGSTAAYLLVFAVELGITLTIPG